MRQIPFILSFCLTLAATTGCAQKAQDGQEESTVASGQTQASAQPGVQSTYITQQELRTKLFDYTNKEFQFLGERPAVLDIYAVWCGPCKQLAPILDELATEFAGQVDFYKLDAEKETEAAAAIGVQAYPTLLLMAPGKEPVPQIGALPKDELKRLIQEKLLQ